MVHALKKGEMKPSDASPEVKKAADSMTKKSTKKYASTKHKGKPERVSKEVVKKLGEMIKQEVAKRDYKAEYKKFQSSTKMKKYRAELNKYNRQKGTYGNGDGKDASHKGGKIVGFEAQSKNRGRAEKSRLKKENIGKRCTVKEVSKWLKTLEEFRYRKVRNVDARRVAAFVNNGMNEEELPTSLQKKWEHKKYGREKHLANKYIETVLNVSLKESVNERKNPKRERAKKDFLKSMKNLEKNVRRIKQFARANEWGAISSFVEDGLVYDVRDLEKEIDTIISLPVEEFVNETPQKVAKLLIKYGNNPKDVKDMVKKHYKKAKKDRSKSTPSELANYISFLSANESVNEGKGVEKILKMASEKSFGKIAGRTVDGMTAGLFKAVYDKAPQNSKDKIDKMSEKQLYVFMGKLWNKFGRQVKLS